MLKVNSSRVDLAEKFQQLIDEYNAGSQNIEALFAELENWGQSTVSEEHDASKSVL